MDTEKQERLEAKGWKVGPVQEFLALSNEEMAYIELKLALSKAMRERRLAQNLTQSQVAMRLGTSQSRIAKAEKGDPSVSIDLLVRSLFALDANLNDISHYIPQSPTRTPPP